MVDLGCLGVKPRELREPRRTSGVQSPAPPPCGHILIGCLSDPCLCRRCLRRPTQKPYAEDGFLNLGPGPAPSALDFKLLCSFSSVLTNKRLRLCTLTPALRFLVCSHLKKTEKKNRKNEYHSSRRLLFVRVTGGLDVPAAAAEVHNWGVCV